MTTGHTFSRTRDAVASDTPLGSVAPSRYLGVGICLSRIGIHLTRAFTERLAAIGLGVAHAGVLRVLDHCGQVSRHDLTLRLGLSGPCVDELVDCLRARGLVEDDETGSWVALSHEGVRVHQQIIRKITESEGALLAGMNVSEARTLLNVLHRLEIAVGLTPRIETMSVDPETATLSKDPTIIV